MVRLKVAGKFKGAFIDTYFNSYMVRLKAARERWIWNEVTFQFLYGAIKSVTRRYSFKIYHNFNSYMVRLKELFPVEAG